MIHDWSAMSLWFYNIKIESKGGGGMKKSGKRGENGAEREKGGYTLVIYE